LQQGLLPSVDDRLASNIIQAASAKERIIAKMKYVTLDQQITRTDSEDMAMDKDRIKGSAQQAKGAVKEIAGKIFGDKKLETDGKTDKVAGKVQNAIGGLKDAVRGK
jgi:uncharacterized protein YjbJ (UPF0337 family)